MPGSRGGGTRRTDNASSKKNRNADKEIKTKLINNNSNGNGVFSPLRTSTYMCTDDTRAVTGEFVRWKYHFRETTCVYGRAWVREELHRADNRGYIYINLYKTIETIIIIH